MKIRRYEGRALEPIRQKIREELGEEAVIISSRQVRRGGLFFGRKLFDVIATAEEAGNQPAAPELSSLVAQQKEHYLGLRRSMKHIDEKLAALEDHFSGSGSACPSPDHPLNQVHAAWRPRLSELARELAAGHPVTDADWHEALATMLPTAAGIHFRATPDSRPDIYALVGPTGVGKTTTLAKLAARCVLQARLNVGILTLDTYRVAAIDQMREYARLLGAELRVAFSDVEVANAVDAFSNKDVVFIDTPGRSQSDGQHLDELNSALGSATSVTSLLVLPAAVRARDGAAILRAFARFSPAALILTKTDEASCCDGLTELLEAAAKPVIYLTNGQRVPEDIAPATPATLAALIMPPTTSQCHASAAGETLSC